MTEIAYKATFLGAGLEIGVISSSIFRLRWLLTALGLIITGVVLVMLGVAVLFLTLLFRRTTFDVLLVLALLLILQITEFLLKGKDK